MIAVSLLVVTLSAAPCDAALSTSERKTLGLDGSESAQARLETLCSVQRLERQSEVPDTPATVSDRRLLASFAEDIRPVSERFGEWLVAALRTVFGNPAADGTLRFFGSGMVWFLGAMAALGAVLLALWATRRALWSRKRRQRGGTPDTAAEPRLEGAPVHLARAEKLSQGSPRESLRESWLAVLSLLEHHRLARVRRSQTNRELGETFRERLQGSEPQLTRRLDELVSRYDHAFYSLTSVSEDQASAFLQEARGFQAALEASDPEKAAQR